jgi:hypothetical protein
LAIILTETISAFAPSKRCDQGAASRDELLRRLS